MSNQNNPQGVDIKDITISPEGDVQGLDDATLNEIAGGVSGGHLDDRNSGCTNNNCQS